VAYELQSLQISEPAGNRESFFTKKHCWHGFSGNELPSAQPQAPQL
jgi:hypothetical protein